MDKSEVIGLTLSFHLVELGEVGGVTQSDPSAQFVAVSDQKMVEWCLLPSCRGLTLVGATVFEQTALFDAIIAPTESTTLVYRVERIDGNSRPRERKSGSHQALAELPQQFRFGHSPKPTSIRYEFPSGSISMPRCLPAFLLMRPFASR